MLAEALGKVPATRALRRSNVWDRLPRRTTTWKQRSVQKMP
jgi:hypothetical protein